MRSERIRRMLPMDRPVLLGLWERSVRATHTFLAEADIAFYRPRVAEWLASGTDELWVLADRANEPMGFLGLSATAIEALFLDPTQRTRGWGRCLVAHAQKLIGGSLTVDVNEQNTDARGFYEALGFVVTGRSLLDDSGRPYPVLHMRRKAPASS